MKFVKSTVFDASVEEVFGFHERPDALSRLLPPWEKIRVLQPPTSLAVGTLVIVEQRLGPFWVRIESEHTAYEKNAIFVDEMRRGPFAQWRHEHRFEQEAAGCRLTDDIDYAPPLGPLGRIADGFLIRPRMRKMFDFRHEVTAAALQELRSS